MAFTVNKKAFCVLEFAKTESIVTVQRGFRIMHHTEPPTDKTIREWYMNSSRVAACSFRSAQAATLPIDMLLSAVSVLVVAQSSSEIPEGLMNNPVFVTPLSCFSC